MHIVARDQIIVSKRQRTGDPKSHRDGDLRSSIETKGLLHPIVVSPSVSPSGTQYLLVAGGRRLANLDWLAEDKELFLCNRQVISPGFIPVIFISEVLSSLDLKKAEFEENKFRSPLPWPDEVQALAEIHALEIEKNPRQTMKATAEMLAPIAKKSAEHLREKINEATIIAKHLHDPAIANARNATEAFTLVISKEEAAIRAIRAKQLKTLPTTIKVHHGDCTKLIPEIPPESVDLFLADPPYAIQAGGGGFRSRTVHHHNYSDGEADAKKVISACLGAGFRACKPRANIFIFTDVNLWDYLQQTAKAMGWSPWRTPLIWAKSESEGNAPWGRLGFRRTYEIIFFATKGERGLISSPIDIFRHNRVSRRDRDHAASKPVSLYRELIECTTMPRDVVLDPCCGSGNSLLACKESNRFGIGIEQDQTYYNLTMAKLAGEDPPNALLPSVADL